MSQFNKPKQGSAEYLVGGVCGLLLASALAIGSYVQSRAAAKIHSIERTIELKYTGSEQQSAKPPIQTVRYESVEWPDDLPKPRELPRPLDLSRFVDEPLPPPNLRLAELPDSDLEGDLSGL